MSELADKAAELIVADLEKLYGSIYSGRVRKEWVDKIASLIRAAVTAPRELVDAERVWCELLAIYVKLNGPFEDRDDYEDIITVSKADLIAALTAQEPKVCEWGFRKFNSTLNPNIYINCKNEPIVAMYYDLSAKPYCPYCGGVIKVKE